MPEDDTDDVKKWLRELSAEAQRTDPFVALREFRLAHPGKPVPPELEFAAHYAAILGEDKAPVSYAVKLEREIDKLIDEEEASKGGSTFSKERIGLFECIDQLRAEKPEMTVEDAAAKALDELHGDDQETASPPENDPIGNLVRSYHRYNVKTLLRQIGDAIANNDEEKGKALLGEYLGRMKFSKTHRPAHKK